MTSWWLALRPKTLTAALVPVVVATALAAGQYDRWEVWVTFCALASATLIQIATNLFNDAIDFAKGADREDRLGPTRVTQSGLLSERAVVLGGCFCLALALGLGVPLVIRGGWPIVSIGVISMALAYGYTGGPFPLAYRGLGDLFVFLFFGLIAVGGVFWLHSGQWNFDVLVAGTQVGLLATVLIAINNLRDHEQDRKVGKYTLAARFGVGFARREILYLLLSAYGLGLYWYWTGRLGPALLPLLSLPLALLVIRGVLRESPSPAFNRFLAQAAGTQLSFGALLTLGFLL